MTTTNTDLEAQMDSLFDREWKARENGDFTQAKYYENRRIQLWHAEKAK